jgi:hypothetical protein
MRNLSGKPEDKFPAPSEQSGDGECGMTCTQNHQHLAINENNQTETQ